MSIQPQPGRPDGLWPAPALYPIDERVWARHDMRVALATHDICVVYRLLQKHGLSQRQIAAMTEQSEISEILSGRKVQAYDVLVRICEGLGVPRGWMGLAYTEPIAPNDEVQPPA